MKHITRGDVRLAYEETGAGARAIVFIHGWCCDHTHFDGQVAHYSLTRRCISVDLRGHGESDAPADGYSIETFADDIAFLCDALALKKPLIVGHSMGGAIAMALAANHPGLPSAIVMLDGAILFPPSLDDFVSQMNAAMHSDGYLEPLTGIFNGMFMATDDAERHARIVAAAVGMPRHVAIGEWDALWKFDSASAAAKCGVPAMYVGSHGPVADLARVGEAMPNAIVAQTAGAGHFHQLEVPDQVNAMIDRFIAINEL